MGRPVKIKESTTVDVGFNNPTGDNAYYGVVGGIDTISTYAHPTMKVRVFPTDNSTSAEGDGFIIRQKGANKFLVGMTTGIDPENAVVGTAIRIEALGDTDWEAMGAPGTYAVGTIFTVTAASAAGTTGTANECGVCVLEDEADSSLNEGFMTITAQDSGSTEFRIKRLSNRYCIDFSDNRYLVNFFDVNAGVEKSGSDSATTTIELVQVDNWNLYG